MYGLVQGDPLHSQWQCKNIEVISSVQESILSKTKKGERIVRLSLCSYNVEGS